MSLHFQKSFSSTIVTGLYSLANVKATIFVSQMSRERMSHIGKLRGKKSHNLI